MLIIIKPNATYVNEDLVENFKYKIKNNILECSFDLVVTEYSFNDIYDITIINKVVKNVIKYTYFRKRPYIPNCTIYEFLERKHVKIKTVDWKIKWINQ